MEKSAGAKIDALKNFAKMVGGNPKPAAAAVGLAGVTGVGGYYGGKHKGKKETAAAFNQYNQAENRAIAQRAYQIGLAQKTANDDYNTLVEDIALAKVANGHGRMFLESYLNEGTEMDKVAGEESPIGETGYDFSDLESLNKMASKSAFISKVKGVFSKKPSSKSMVPSGGSGVPDAMKTHTTTTLARKAKDHVAKNKKTYLTGAGLAGAGYSGYAMGKDS